MARFELADNSAEILTLLSGGLGPSLHCFPEDVPLSSIAATLIGMANAEGGVVIFGISSYYNDRSNLGVTHSSQSDSSKIRNAETRQSHPGKRTCRFTACVQP
jgi:predicted HTH transcriptional regulator